MKGVAVTGIGMISALGRGLKAHVEGLQRPTTTLAPLTMFTTAGLDPRPVGQVQDALLAGRPSYSRSQRPAPAAAYRKRRR